MGALNDLCELEHVNVRFFLSEFFLKVGFDGFQVIS